MRRARNYFAWQSRLIRPHLGRRVIEIGCGIGNFTREILGCEKIVAVDSEPACVEIVAKEFPGVECFVRDIGRESIADLARFRPDSCLFINVLEHVENDRQAVCDAAELLAPGGSVIIFVPAFQSLFGPIDRHLGHYRRYAPRAIRELADAAGLRVARLHHVNAVGFLGWWANARIFRREAQSEVQIDVFDRWIVPVMSRVETVIRPPFGQSLLAVLRKE